MNINKARPPVIDEILNKIGESYTLTMQREGVHCTDAIYCLKKAFWNKTDPLPATPQEILYYLTGLGLQDVFLSAFPHDVICMEGIWMSPDYSKDNVLVELKTTMIGRKRLDEYDFPEGWMKQLKAYCYGFKVDRIVLAVITLIHRELLTYILSFTDGELEDNWLWIKTRAEALQECLSQNVIPGMKGFDFECGSNCRYQLRCLTLEREERNVS